MLTTCGINKIALKYLLINWDEGIVSKSVCDLLKQPLEFNFSFRWYNFNKKRSRLIKSFTKIREVTFCLHIDMSILFFWMPCLSMHLFQQYASFVDWVRTQNWLNRSFWTFAHCNTSLKPLLFRNWLISFIRRICFDGSLHVSHDKYCGV